MLTRVLLLMELCVFVILNVSVVGDAHAKGDKPCFDLCFVSQEYSVNGRGSMSV